MSFKNLKGKIPKIIEIRNIEWSSSLYLGPNLLLEYPDCKSVSKNLRDVHAK